MSNQTLYTTQDHLDILDIKDDYVVLKNGVVCSVLQTNAVNFDLLSEIEQDAIIAAFSMLLNSITFPIQIVIRSKKLDISKYIEKVQRVETKIQDPLLRHQAEAYRKFVQEVIKTNEVLDKKFYVVVPTKSSAPSQTGTNGPFDWILRLMGTTNKRHSFDFERVLSAAKVEINPKVEHIIREFSRLGIKSKPMNTQELVELYFDIYNPTTSQGQRIRTSIEDYKTAIVNPAIVEG
jgi:type IV secretory pathway VirB4 component